LAEGAEEGIEAVMAEHYTTLGGQPRWDHGEEGVLIDALFSAYKHWCEATGSKAFKKENLGQHVRQAFSGVERHRITAEGGRRPWVYKGLPRKGRS
jgi:hypothetical protein